MYLQVALFAVDGHKELGLDQGVHNHQLLLTGMAGDMEGTQALVDHFCALPVQLVDDRADGMLVARDSGSGEDNAVTRLDFDLPMGGEGNPGEGGHGLALAASGDDTDFIAGQAFDLVQVCQGAFWHLHVTQLGGYL